MQLHTEAYFCPVELAHFVNLSTLFDFSNIIMQMKVLAIDPSGKGLMIPSLLIFSFLDISSPYPENLCINLLFQI